MMADSRPRKVVIVGAGPVGCLAALSMAKLGCVVEIYEGRSDMRLSSPSAALARRSVNLAISSRGLAALEFVDVAIAARFLETVIPMRGRVLHNQDGSTETQVYDTSGNCINSIDRGLLNQGLLDEAAAHSSISTHFNHKLSTADFDTRILWFETPAKETIAVAFDLCIGADGSYSNVRRQLMRVVRMDYQQEYIPHEYIELRLPPGPKSTPDLPEFLLDPNGLHIWPRHSFMLIALPNKNGSFTCTLFAPNSELAHLREADTIVPWFRTYFPDALALIGEEAVVNQIAHNPRSALISIKANPYHYKDRVIILGDAAHSMVPFYGQGLNCGLEDVRVLSSLMISSGMEGTVANDRSIEFVDQKLAGVLEEYTTTRHQDLVAIRDLAMENYIEMRHSVTTRLYRLRKSLDAVLSRAFPSPARPMLALGPETQFTESTRAAPQGWISLYSMVTFRPDIPYALAREKDAWQRRTIDLVGQIGLTIAVAGIVIPLAAWVNRRLP